VEQERRLGGDVGEQAGTAEPVVVRIPAAKEEHEPARREAQVEERVPDVEPVDDPGEAQERPLHRGLDVEPERVLDLHDPLRVPSRTCAAVRRQYEPAHEQVEGVHGEDEGNLAPGREAAHSTTRQVIG
jgi:hypothetical protein